MLQFQRHDHVTIKGEGGARIWIVAGATNSSALSATATLYGLDGYREVQTAKLVPVANSVRLSFGLPVDLNPIGG